MPASHKHFEEFLRTGVMPVSIVPEEPTMMKYRKKPVEVEAVQFKGWENAAQIAAWGNDMVYVPRGADHFLRYEHELDLSNGRARDDAREFLAIKTLDATARADVGDFVVKGISGEFYPCKPDIFWGTYDPVDEEDDDE